MKIKKLIEELRKCNPDYDVQYCADIPLNISPVLTFGCIDNELYLFEGVRNTIIVKDLITQLEPMIDSDMEVFFMTKNKHKWETDSVTSYNQKVQIQH